MDAATATTALQNNQFSRYRSVRKAAARSEHTQPTVPELPSSVASQQNQATQSPVARTPSRYHRKPTAPHIDDVPIPTQKSHGATIRSHARPTTNKPQPIVEAPNLEDCDISKSAPFREKTTNVPKQIQKDETPQRSVDISANARRTTRYRSKTTSTPKNRPTSPGGSYDAAREQARAILEGEYDRLSRLKQQQEMAERERKQRAEARAAAARHEQAKVEQEKRIESVEPETQQALPPKTRKWTIGGSSQGSPPVTAPSSPPSAEGSHTIQPSLSRKVSKIIRRVKTEEVIAEKPPVPAVSPAGFVDQPVPKKRERRPTTTRTKDAAATRTYAPKAGDGPPKTAIAAPQTVDAPVSAVNAGDRRVEIRCEGSKITLPVTPSTTVRELINSASIIMSQQIDPRKSVLIETYYPLGLERPLRRYERVRDVMNSWDSDTQNYLMIMPESECDARGLDQKDAPQHEPPHTMLNLLHSQKPGKWEKHWMILKEDGQVTASKTENDGNATNVFHLSDFDVYMPTKKEMRKLKPPKKICFAIKSQQRSIMFESTENFVHFFSTNDKAVADEWYNTVQAWRSWYLVNILDQGGVAKPPLASAAPINNLPMLPRPSTSHSRDSIPYQLGTFEPLLEFSVDAFKYGEDESQNPKPAQPAAPKSPKRSKTLVDHARNNSNVEANTIPRRSGTTRKQGSSTTKPPKGLADEAKNEIREVRTVPILASTEEGFTGKGLLARAFSVRKAQAEENAAIYDNTDNAFTGTGLLARKMSTKKFANDNVVVPENTNDAFTGSGLLARKMSTRKYVNENAVVPENTNDAFTGRGLVQRTITTKRSQVGRPGQPLVDLGATSEFADRSLLRNVEAYEIAQGNYGPVIDRSKATEVNTKTGEI